MFIYIIEICAAKCGQILFDPLVSNYPEISFIDERAAVSLARRCIFRRNTDMPPARSLAGPLAHHPEPAPGMQP